jgi:hypothetical protein
MTVVENGAHELYKGCDSYTNLAIIVMGTRYPGLTDLVIFVFNINNHRRKRYKRVNVMQVLYTYV